MFADKDIKGTAEQIMMKQLFIRAILKFISGLLVVGLLIFVPAGTLRFPNGWLLIGFLFIPMFFAGIIMMFSRPDLLQKRLNAGEEQNEQKQVILFSGLIFIVSFILAGLNFRFGWLFLPVPFTAAASVIFLLSWLLYGEVLRENVWLSRTVEVQENQQVIDTGLYGIVRHPMYTATVFLFLSMPLVLGSPLSFAVMLLYLPIIVKRIRNEEFVLAKGLKGYKEYMTRVKYRLIPGLW